MENSAIYWLVGVGTLIIYLILTYNRGVGLRNYVREAFATMDVYLKKRWDLVPNLIEIVKNYAKHEKTLLEDVTKLRTKSYNELSDAQKLETNVKLGQQLSRIVAVAENYPDLKANQSYMLLMQQVSAVEEDIAAARKYYNGTVREFNTFLDIFPTNFIGKFFGWQRAEMFEIEKEQRDNIKVEM